MNQNEFLEEFVQFLGRNCVVLKNYQQRVITQKERNDLMEKFLEQNRELGKISKAKGVTS